MKPCSICKDEKPLDDFAKCDRNKDGHRAECKECQRDEAIRRKEVKNLTYADRIMAILKKHDKPMWINDLRDAFKAESPEVTTRKQEIAMNSGISSALVNMRDRGEIRIAGGGHGNSIKMISIIQKVELPKNARLIRLSDTMHWHDTPIRSHGVGIHSSMMSLINMCG